MPVTVVCDKCGRQLRIADEQVGKRAKCPQCKEIILLQPAGEKVAASSGTVTAPATATKTAGGSGKSAKGKDWFVLTADQQEFGPINKAELDTWISEGRLDNQCQVLQEGWEQWRWADEIFPELAASTTPAPTPGPAAPMSISAMPTTTPSGPAFSTGPASYTAPLPGAGPADVNPYASPGVMPTPTMGGSGSMDMNGQVPLNVLTPLRNTQGWILVFVVLGGLSFVLCLLGMLAMVGMMFVARAPGGALSVILMFAPSLTVTGLFTYLLYRYWDAIGNCSRQPNFANLQKALEAQQNYWMTLAIGVLILIGIQVVLSIAMTLLGAAVFNSFSNSMH